MLYLRLFGSPTLRTAEGAPLTGRAAQRHRLALLGLLALSGKRGSSRERLMALLWPESDLERARNLLNVSVYVLRQALGEDALVSNGDELCLNPERIEADVAAFEAALERGDHERAVALYHGPLFDGFFLKDAPDFERWVDGERERLAGAHAKALDALAEAAETRGDLRGAVEWWQAGAAQKPYDSRIALRLMRALEASGNPAGALHHASIHERLLEEEFGIGVAPEVAALAGRLRARPAASVSRQTPSFRLETFGGLALHGPGGPVAAEGGARDPLSLALLAVLAAAGDHGLDRNRLLLLFWPDASQHAAREALDQALRTIRTAIHETAIAGTDPLKLDSAIITSDVADFESALDRDQLDEAIAHYRGPFLDRFHFGDSPEFEQWVDTRRARLAAQRDAALERLARPAERAEVRTTAVTKPASEAPRKSRLRHAPWYGAVVLSLSALIAFWPGAPTPAADVPRIAVLPLGNLSADPIDAPLADAMTEELISMIGREPDRLRAISSSSAFLFRDRQTDVRGIADSLGVAHILEGSVRKIDTRVRLMVRLVDGRDGSTRWSETYEREYRDIFAEMENVARAVARALDVRLANVAGTGILSNRTQSGPVSDGRLAAVDLYIQASSGVLHRSEGGHRQAVALFRQAIALDSTYAPAHAGLARMLAGGEGNGSRRDRLALAEKAARTAIELDSLLAEAQGALGGFLLNDYQFAKAEAQLQRAIQLDPTRSEFRNVLVWLYVFMDRPRDALDEARRAVDESPHLPAATAELARALLLNGRCDEAMELLDRLAHLQPPLARAADIAGECYAQRGMWQEAIAALRPNAENFTSRGSSFLAFLLARAGQRAEALQILDTLLERAKRANDGAFEVAVVYAGLGEFDRAFEWLERSIDDRSMRFEIMHPSLEELRRDPRFDQVRRKLGIQKR